LLTYAIDMHAPDTRLIPCTVRPSTANPGYYNLVLENGYSVCIEPNGTHVRDIAPNDPNFDSAWTQAAFLAGDKLIFRSSNGTPHGFIIIR